MKQKKMKNKEIKKLDKLTAEMAKMIVIAEQIFDRLEKGKPLHKILTNKK